MTLLKRALLVAVLCGCATAAVAQTGGGTPGAATGGGGAGQGGGAGGGTPILELPTAPTITSTTQGGVINSGVLGTCNLLGNYYANPLYQGARVPTGNLTGVVPAGGFGQPTFGNTGSTGANGTGLAGRTAGAAGTNATGRTGGGATAQPGGQGLNRQGGASGGAFGNSSQNTNQQLATGRNIAYTQTLKFGVAAMTPTQVQADVVGTLASSSSISNSAGVLVQATDNGGVTLQGVAKDEDEARLIEGLVLLTPGVKRVKNELSYPKP